MIIERSMQQDWLSNAYLVGDEENGKAVVIDSGGPAQPLLEAADRHGLDGGDRHPRHRPVRAGIQVGDPLKYRELCSELLHAGRNTRLARP